MVGKCRIICSAARVIFFPDRQLGTTILKWTLIASKQTWRFGKALLSVSRVVFSLSPPSRSKKNPYWKLISLNQNICGNMQFIVELPYNAKGQLFLPAQYINRTIFLPNQFTQIILIISQLFHPKLNCFNRIWQADREILIFVFLYKYTQHFKFIAIRGSLLCIKDDFKPFQSLFIIFFCIYWFNNHSYIFDASILSYSACVPINRIQTNWYS